MQQFTENAIMEHFEQMLREMPFDKITVTALARHCEISPNTFYYHFSDIYDLLDHWLVRMLEPYVKSSEQQWQASVKQLLHRLKKEKKLVYHLFNSISRDRLEWPGRRAGVSARRSCIRWQTIAAMRFSASSCASSGTRWTRTWTARLTGSAR